MYINAAFHLTALQGKKDEKHWKEKKKHLKSSKEEWWIFLSSRVKATNLYSFECNK